jgi:MarR family transcriptional regulator for hemolysin
MAPHLEKAAGIVEPRGRLEIDKHAYYKCGMDRNFAFELADTARLLRREFDRRAAAHGVTRAQWRVLARLGRQDGMRQIELADALDVEPITLCRMIDRLAEAGLVERRRDDEDRRAWRIHLTPKAGPIIERLRTLAETFFREALAGVPEAQQAQVLGTLARIRSNIASGSGAARRAS